MHSRNWFCSWEAGRSGSRRRRQRRLWMSPRPSPSQTQAPRTGCSPQQDNHTARCTHKFFPQAVYAHLEDSGRKADVTLAGGGLPARKRTARPRLTRMWSTWARLRRWTRSFRWGYDERPRHNAQTDRVLDLLQRNSTGAFPIEAERHVVENLPASSGSVRTRRDGALASTRGKASAIRYVTESPGLDCFQLPRRGVGINGSGNKCRAPAMRNPKTRPIHALLAGRVVALAAPLP